MNPVTPHSCASCGVADCEMNRRHGVTHPSEDRTAYLLDDVWPEYASMISAEARPQDQLIAPRLFGATRYRWPGDVDHRAILSTVRRHIAMRRVAKADGGTRQRTYLRHDRALALELATGLDYRARHLVVAQTWLPWLEETGALGGRSFDVVMSRYPMAAIHRMLDAAMAETGALATIADFRADDCLVARETALLARARRVITPHHGIAALFPDSAFRLAWHRPGPMARMPGNRTAFLGPTIARQRPDIACALATSLDQPLIVFGAMIEPAAWAGLAIERRTMGPGWLDNIGAILHPAVVTNQPRSLLQAISSGVRVYATPESGLDPSDYMPLD